jgi:hypothetical protein
MTMPYAFDGTRDPQDRDVGPRPEEVAKPPRPRRRVAGTMRTNEPRRVPATGNVATSRLLARTVPTPQGLTGPEPVNPLPPAIAGVPTGTAPAEPRYSLRLALAAGRPEVAENLTRAEALARLRQFRRLLAMRYESALDSHRYLRSIRQDQWIVGGISAFLGGVRMPSEDIWQPALAALREGDNAFAGSDVVRAAQEYQRSVAAIRHAEQRVMEYREGTIGGAGLAVGALEVVEVASAATVTIGTGGVAGVFAGAGYGAAQQLAGQASEMHQGLRQRIDWAGIGFDALVGVVTGYLGGRLGDAVLGRLLRIPGAASLGGRVLSHAVSDVVAGKAGSTLHAAARMVFDQLRGQENVTYDIFVHRLAANLTDPRGAFLDTILGAANRRALGMRRPTPAVRTPVAATSFGRSAFARGLRSRVLGAVMRGLTEAVPATKGTGGGPAAVIAESLAGAGRARIATSPVEPPTARAPAEAAIHPAHPAPLEASTGSPAATVSGPSAASTPGVVTQAPEVSAGFAAEHVRPLANLLGRRLATIPSSRIAAVWNSVARAGQAARLTATNSRRWFNNHRIRFWAAARGDAQLMQQLTEAGLKFGAGRGSAPYYELPNGDRIQITIDHIVERQSDPSRALDSGNLQLSFRLENTTLLRLIHALDPFQHPPPQ